MLLSCAVHLYYTLTPVTTKWLALGIEPQTEYSHGVFLRFDTLRNIHTHSADLF